jgi:hypothetical protein
MRRFIAQAFVFGGVCAVAVVAGGVSWLGAAPLQVVGAEQSVLDADKALVAALGRSDSAAAGPMLDAEFAWTTSAGDTLDKAKVVAALPKPPLGDEGGAQVGVRIYGQIGAVQAASGKVHVLRVWGKRASGWRLLVYHEVTQRAAPPPPGGPPTPTTNDCENPCKGVPYTPKNAAEKGILTSWGQLETAVTNHQPTIWAPHFLDEFVLINSGGTEPVDKAGRISQLSRPGIGPAPAALAADPVVRFIALGDAVVMIAQTKPYAGKPAHVSRIWVNRDGMWRMALSYQTTIQAAPAIVPPEAK